MRRISRVLLAAGALLGAVPYLAWLADPRSVLAEPEVDPTGLLGFVYEILFPGAVLGTPTFWFYGLLTLGGLGATALALILVWRAWNSPGVPLLALFLVSNSVFFGFMLLAAPHGQPAWLWAQLVASSGPALLLPVSALFGVGLAALVIFASTFPRELAPSDFERFMEHEHTRPKSTYKRFGARLKVSIDNSFLTLGDRLGVKLTDDPSPAAQLERMRSMYTLWVEGRLVWLVLPASSLASVALVALWPDLWAIWSLMYYAPVSLLTLFVAHLMFRVGAVVSDGEDRLRIAWISSGISAALWLWIVFGVLAFGLTWLPGDVGLTIYMGGLFVYGPLAMAIVIVTALGAAVLVGGAVDPALAIRRTTVYGTLVLLFAFGFAAIEEMVSEILVGRIGISDRGASILLGATVAVAVAPLKSMIDRAVGAWLPDGGSPLGIRE